MVPKRLLKFQQFAPQIFQKIRDWGVPKWIPSQTSPSLPDRKTYRSSHLHEVSSWKSSEVERALDKARSYLFQIQDKEGFWEGHVYDNVTITCEYVMFLRFLGLLNPKDTEKAKNTILEDQNSDGGWPIYGGGPSNHSATVEAYFVLKLCGIPETDSIMKMAREKILKNGGVETTRVFTKIHLALFGQYPWKKIPIINPELMFVPPNTPFHIYEFSSWSRSVIIPLVIIFDQKPVVSLPSDQHVTEILVPEPKKQRREQWKNLIRKGLKLREGLEMEMFFHLAQNMLSLYEFKVPLKPLRKQALDLAENWILEHQDPKGNWGGIFPAMANSILALQIRGYSLDHPVIQKGLTMLRSFAEETPRTLRMQSTISPIWDTAIAAYALTEAKTPCHKPELQKTKDWLIQKQILDVYGDWKFKSKPTRPGGWPFEHENSQYPDIDDSALALLSLYPHESSSTHPELTSCIDRGIEWMVGMQGSDGGWGAFDRDNNRKILNQIPFADLKSLIDPSTPDVTGHVLEALGRGGFSLSSEPAQKALDFLRKTQESNGSWFGRWGVNYIYGTGAVLSGLKEIHENMELPYIKKACDWLTKIQNKDGGWGESCASYDEKKYISLGHSTPSQTAWALLGLLSSPLSSPESIQRGIRYLLQKQQKNGIWSEPEWTGTGFPSHFYLRYDYYRLYFPLLALGRFVSRGEK